MQQVQQAVQVSEPVQMIPYPEIDATRNVRTAAPGDGGPQREAMEGLIASVRSIGIQEPLLVAPQDGDGSARRYRLVFGHRRLSAAIAAGLKAVPCIVRTMSEAEIREAQLVENLQREDLGALDEARAFQAYLASTKAPQSELARKIGKSQPYVANRLRLLQLRPDVQEHIARGILSPSHGEILLKVPPEMSWLQGKIAKEAIRKKADVRDLERNVRYEIGQEQKRLAFKEKLKTIPHKRCPNCGGEAVEARYGDVVQCAKYHEWNGTTGKSPYASERSYSRAPQKKKDKAESPTTRSLHDILAIVRELVSQIEKPEQVRHVQLNTSYLSIKLSNVPAAFKGLEFNAVRHEYTTGERTEVQVAAWDPKHRKAAKDLFHAWERKHLPKIAAPKKRGVKVDPKLLEGSVNDVLKKMPGGRSNIELLEELRALEAGGKNRNGILETIDVRIRDLTRG